MVEHDGVHAPVPRARRSSPTAVEPQSTAKRRETGHWLQAILDAVLGTIHSPRRTDAEGTNAPSSRASQSLGQQRRGSHAVDIIVAENHQRPGSAPGPGTTDRRREPYPEAGKDRKAAEGEVPETGRQRCSVRPRLSRHCASKGESLKLEANSAARSGWAGAMTSGSSYQELC